ncbi:MAG: beta-glycosidase [Bacteroidetes bacterium]|nr:beta-glycosidase [Bacteroidota bacterium]
MKILFAFFILMQCFVSSALLYGQESYSDIRLPSNGQKALLNRNWYAIKASKVSADGIALTSIDMHLDDLIPAEVPGTVLKTLLLNRIYPNPYFSSNNDSIPDINVTGTDFYTYWFISSFRTSNFKKGKNYWLNFRGINYKAEIYLNGKKINKETHVGMFLRESYNITQYLNTDGTLNKLAVLVLPPDPPGNDNGGQGGDGAIGSNVTNQFSAGWDWIPAVHDRNTGIWDEVSITCTGNVRIKDPLVLTDVPGVRVPGGKQADAYIRISTGLINESNQAIKGTLNCLLNNSQQVSKTVTLGPHELRRFTMNSLRVHNPRLWWPNGIGSQDLNDIEIRFTSQGVLSDSMLLKTGIRSIKSSVDTNTKSRLFYVNGQKIFIRGGNWIATDWMLTTPELRYEQEIRMHKEMNLNLIRVWGGSITERPEFYDACDQNGILVMQDLWVTGDCNGAWNDPMKKDSRDQRRKYPDDHNLFISSAIDQVLMLRNHPSLCFWCGGNEFHPPADIDTVLQHFVFPTYDPSRVYVNSSFSRDLTLKLPMMAGDGPYGIQEPEWFYFPQANPFNPEMGSVGLPEIESLKEILPEKEWIPPFISEQIPNWRYHRFASYGDHTERYGPVKSLEEYCSEAQLANYLQYKSFLEGETSRMFETYTGVVIWRTQNPWTALGGQMYDWFLAQNACFYGLKSACEPVHIQLNLDDSTIAVTNTTPEKLRRYSYSIKSFEADGKLISQEEGVVDIDKQSVKEICRLPVPLAIGNLFFLSLELKDPAGKPVSHNLLWLNKKGKDYSELRKLPNSVIVGQAKIETGQGKSRIQLTLTNNGGHISFFNRLLLKDLKTGKRILPAFYSDNYVSLLPGATRFLTIEFASDENLEPVLELNGWNTGFQRIAISSAINK